MKQHEAVEQYIFSKTNIQLVHASLEELTINRINPNLITDLHNEISFGTKIKPLVGNEVEAYLIAVIDCKSSWDGPTEIQMQIVYKGIFQSKVDVEQEEFRKWTEIQVTPQLVPYIRSLVSTLSIQMMIEPIMLPTMDIIQSIVENSNEVKIGK